MNESESLLSTLSRGEKKMISQRLQSLGKQQLFNVYSLQKRGFGQREIAERLNLSGKNIAILLFQLKEFTLKQLTLNGSKQSIEIELRNSLSEIEILKSRFLFDQALKKINHLKPIMLNHERFNFLQELLLLQVDILQFSLPEKQYRQALKTIMKEYSSYQLKNDYYYRQKTRFYEVMAGLNTSSHSLTPKTFPTIAIESNRSGEYYKMRHQLVSQLTNKDPECVTTSVLLIATIEENRHEFERLPFQILDTHFMAALSFIFSNDQKRYIHCSNVMKEIEKKHKSLKNKYSERSCYLNWVQASIGSDLKLDIKLLIEQYKGLRKTISLEFDLRILEQIANYFLVTSDYKNAKKWNNEIVNKYRKEQRKQFNLRAKIRDIYIAKMVFDYEYMCTLIDRVLSSPSREEYSKKVIDNLRLLKVNKEVSCSSILNYIDFWLFKYVEKKRKE
ncbi:MAG: hypothetical protein COA38_18245 [Fluviicola sp.]|nr:MAG: hypothetical protein COA38_18245 [Fluviicola sp.]